MTLLPTPNNDVRITFYMELASVAKQLTTFVQDLRAELENLGQVGQRTMNQMQTATTEATTSVEKLGNAFAQQLPNKIRAAEADMRRFAQVAQGTFSIGGGEQVGAFGNFNQPVLDFELMAQRQASAMQSAMAKFQNQFPTTALSGTGFNVPRGQGLQNRNFSNVGGNAVVTNAATVAAMNANNAIQAFKTAIPVIGDYQNALGKTVSALESVGTGIVKVSVMAKLQQQAMESLGKSWKLFITYLPLAILYELSSVFKDLSQKAIEFDTAIHQVAVTTGMTGDVLRRFSDEVLHIASQVPQSATELVDAYNIIAKAGFRGADALSLTKDAGMLATVGFTNATNAAKILTTILTSYGDKAGSVNHIMDMLVKATQIGGLSIDDLADSMGRVAKSAAVMGVKVDEVAGTLAVMTKHGLTAEQSATLLDRIMLKLAKSSAKGGGGANEANTLGNAMNARVLAEQGLTGVIQNLNKDIARHIELAKAAGIATMTWDQAAQTVIQDYTGLSGEELAKLFPDQRALREVVNFMGGEVPDAINKIKDSTGAMQTAYDNASSSFANAGKMMLNYIQQGYQPLAERIMPMLAEMGLIVARVLGVVLQLVAKSVEVIIKLAPIILTAALAWAIYDGAVLAAGAAAIASATATIVAWAPVAGVIIGVALAVRSAMHIMDKLAGTVQETGNVFIDLANDVVHALKGIIIISEVVGQGFKAMGIIAIESFGYLVDNAVAAGQLLWNAFLLIPKGIYQMFAYMVRAVVDALAWMVNKATDGLNLLIKGINLIPGVNVPLIPKVNFDGVFDTMEAGYDKLFGKLGANPKFSDNLGDRIKKAIQDAGIKGVQDIVADADALLPDIKRGAISSILGIDFSIEPQSSPQELQKQITAASSAASQQNELVSQIIQETADKVSQVSQANTDLVEAIRQSTTYLLNMGKSAQQVADALASARAAQIADDTIKFLTDMRNIANQYTGNAVIQADLLQKINLAMLTTQETFLNASSSFLDNLLSMGSPEDLARLFAQQHYISQSINQSVVIAPYIELNGVEDSEKVTRVVNNALTQWANSHGLSLGTVQ